MFKPPTRKFELITRHIKEMRGSNKTQFKPISTTEKMSWRFIPKPLLSMAYLFFSFSLFLSISYLIINNRSDIEILRLETESPNRAVVYLASSATTPRDMDVSLSQLCSVFSSHSHNYELVFVRFPWEEPVTVFPATCVGRFSKVVHIAIDPKYEGNTAKDAFANIKEGLGYRLMIWFWLRVVVTHEAFSQYEYIVRLDSDSVLLSPIKQDPVDILASSKALIGYHCFTYENPTVAISLQAVADDYVAQRNSTYANFAYPNDSFPMFYTNFLVLDRSNLSQRQDFIDFTDNVVAGIVSNRWGDAPLWALITGLFMTPHDVVHLNGFDYQHGHGNRFITLEGNNEVINWDFEDWKSKTSMEPIGHCWDRRVPQHCVLLNGNTTVDDRCPMPFYSL